MMENSKNAKLVGIVVVIANFELYDLVNEKESIVKI